MMMITRPLLIALISTMVSIGMIMSVTAADDLPYSRAGIIDSIHQDSNEIIISDWTYSIAPYVIVHKRNSDFVGTQYLKPSMAVGFRMEKSDGAKPSITQVWILDADELERMRRNNVQLIGNISDQ